MLGTQQVPVQAVMIPPSKQFFLPLLGSELPVWDICHHSWVCRREKGQPGSQQRFIHHNMEICSIYHSYKTMTYVLLILLLKMLMKTAI